MSLGVALYLTVGVATALGVVYADGFVIGIVYNFSKKRSNFFDFFFNFFNL
jgi:hypothetical protein